MTIWERFDRWFAAAIDTEPRVPEAMQLATASPDGMPSVRTVLLKDFGPEGLVFYTNLKSRKAADLEANPRCAFVLHFKGLERQILGQGDVRPLEPHLADAYFSSRERGSRIGAWASRQSTVIESREALIEQVARFEEQFGDGHVPRPEFWGGYRILPTRIEFWQGKPDRLHERLVFERTPQGWAQSLLAP